MQGDWIRSLHAASALHAASSWVKLVRAPRRIAFMRWAAWRGRRNGAWYPASARLFWGDRMRVVLPDPVSAMLYAYGHYEPELSEFLLRFLEPGSVAADVGAHFGYYSLLMSRLVGERGTVHAFEPTPRTFALLEANLGPCTNVRPNRAAVWREDTTLELSDFGSGLATFNSVAGGRLEDPAAQAASFRVPAVALDGYFERSGQRVDFLKIDAENAEAEVLEGMRGILASQRPVFSLEVGDLGPDGAGRTQTILSRLEVQGYAMFRQERGGLVPQPAQERYAHGNVIALPRERADGIVQRFPARAGGEGRA
jgi:FkbM family methyltransferase